MRKNMIMKKYIFAVALIALMAENSFALDIKSITGSLTSSFGSLTSVLSEAQSIPGQLSKLPGELKGISGSVKELNAQLKCLPKPGAGNCTKVNCTNHNACAGAALANFVRIIKPAGLFLGEMTERTAEGSPTKFKPGLLPVIIFTLAKITGEIPAPESLKGTLAKLTSLLNATYGKAQSFAVAFDTVLSFLNGLSASLNPASAVEGQPVMAIEAIEIKPDAAASEFIIDEVPAAVS